MPCWRPSFGVRCLMNASTHLVSIKSPCSPESHVNPVQTHLTFWALTILTDLLCTGSYNLPVGSYEITLKAADSCAGSDFCTTLVTVADLEALDPALLSCGALPADGVLEVSPWHRFMS